MTEMFTDDAVIVDRSTLEPWATCPLQAALMRGVKQNNEPMSIGNEFHRIVSDAVKERQVNGAQPRELRDLMTSASFDSRPDVQPRVAHVVRIASWPIAQLLCVKENNNARHPDDILKYDGGADDRSGQIAADFTLGETTYRLTCELDLLMATDSPEELDYLDWKSGWTHWTASDAKESFQFQFYALLILIVYPKVNRVRVRVFMCGEGAATGVVEFDRKDMFIWQRRVLTALEIMAGYQNTPIEQVDAWPGSEKCATCPAALRCTQANPDDTAVAVDPGAFLRRYVAVDAIGSRMKSDLTKYVKAQGSDIECDGIAFGSNKPTTARAKPMDYYDVPDESKQADRPEGKRQDPSRGGATA